MFTLRTICSKFLARNLRSRDEVLQDRVVSEEKIFIRFCRYEYTDQ